MHGDLTCYYHYVLVTLIVLALDTIHRHHIHHLTHQINHLTFFFVLFSNIIGKRLNPHPIQQTYLINKQPILFLKVDPSWIRPTRYNRTTLHLLFLLFLVTVDHLLSIPFDGVSRRHCYNCFMNMYVAVYIKGILI